MKVKATLLPTGGYHYELIEKVLPREFTIMAQDVRVPETYRKWDDQVTRNLELRLDLVSMESIINTGKAGMILSAMGFHSYPRGKEEEYVLRYKTETLATKLRLKNVRKAETKLARVNEALEDIAQKSDPDGDYFRGWMETVTKNINERLSTKFVYENRMAMGRFSDFLHSKNEWATATDDKAGVNEAKAQVEYWHTEIERLEEKIRSHEEFIREARSDVFVKEWIDDKWIWTNTSDNDVEVYLPKEYQEKVIEMRADKTLFKAVYPPRIRMR